MSAARIRAAHRAYVTLLGKKTAPVGTLAEAQRLAVEDRDANDVGSSEWYARGAGRVVLDGVVVAHVSYNGRVWLGRDRYAPGQREAADLESPLDVLSAKAGAP